VNEMTLAEGGIALGGGAAAATSGGRLAGSVRNANPLRGTTNCVNCVIATNATLSGRPAGALLSGATPISVLERTFGGAFARVGGQSAIEAQLLNAGHGAQGVVFGSRGAGQVGHVFNAINQNGVVRFLDGQTGRAASFAGFRDLFFMPIPR
jgi:filamentous hemagglutinin